VKHQNRSRCFGFIFLLLTVIFLPACRNSGEQTHPKKPNLILIVLDTLRADHLSCYGDKAHTPNLDRLAAQGTLFQNAYSHIPVTGPSHASMFTGLLPVSHGVRKNTDILSKSFQTVAEDLKNSGYSTYAVVSLGVLKARFGFAQGFDVYQDQFENQWFLRAGQVTDTVASIIPEKAKRPTFLFAHFSDPHEPYSPPGPDYPSFEISLDGKTLGTCHADGMGCRFHFSLESGAHELQLEFTQNEYKNQLGFRQLELRGEGISLALGKSWSHPEGSAPGRLNRCILPATLDIHGENHIDATLSFFANEIIDLAESQRRYTLEVEYADREIGRLLEILQQRGYLEDALVVFTGDHGEGLGQHGLLGHKKQVYDSLLRIPLIMASKNRIPQGLNCDIPLGHIDMNASIRKFLGIGAAPGSPGRPVLQDFLEHREVIKRPILAMTFPSSGGMDLRAAVLGRFKLIRNLSSGIEEFYDTGKDPEEKNNIFCGSGMSALGTKEIDTLEVLGSALDSVAGKEQTAPSADTATLSPEEKARLEALGYTQ